MSISRHNKHKRTVDQTGQINLGGYTYQLTTAMWEDEGTHCYQVNVGGFTLARRADDHMINGTKLLSLGNMTRHRRDEILNSERVRHVVVLVPHI
jgi:protein SOK2